MKLQLPCNICSNFCLLAILFLAIVIIYAPHLNNGFVFDDHPQIEINPLVQGEQPWEKVFTQNVWSHVPSVEQSTSFQYYRPLFTLAHRLTFQAGNGSAEAFHLLNLSLHLFVTFLVFFALCLLNFNSTQAFVATTLFALNPLAGEVVYWASCTSELLLQIGFLLSMICVVGSSNYHTWKRILLLFGANIALLFALLAKGAASSRNERLVPGQSTEEFPCWNTRCPFRR